jgi:hypothetical protein
MLEMGTSGLMSGAGKRGGASASVPAPGLDSTFRGQVHSITVLFNTTQLSFSGSDWNITPPRAALVMKKYGELEQIEGLAKVRLGMITGLDDVFVVTTAQLKQLDVELFVPLLADREMEPYRVPATVRSAVFYPFREVPRVTEDILKKQYPKAWTYLSSHRQKLASRRAVRKGQIPWWRPERPRQPKHLFQPKIVTPHVVIAPRFSLDSRGRFAISHSPYLVVEQQSQDDGSELSESRNILLYLLAALNSTAAFWYIAQQSHVYERGYSRLEVATLKKARIPSFASMEPSLRLKILRLVDARLLASGDAALRIEAELDDFFANAYGLSSENRQVIGM